MNEKRRSGPRRADRFAERAAPVEEVEGQLEGRNAVAEALKSGRTIDKLFIAEGDTDQSLRRLLEPERKLPAPLPAGLRRCGLAALAPLDSPAFMQYNKNRAKIFVQDAIFCR